MIVNKYELYANDTDMLQIQLTDDLSSASYSKIYKFLWH